VNQSVTYVFEEQVLQLLMFGLDCFYRTFAATNSIPSAMHHDIGNFKEKLKLKNNILKVSP
jgi:hypothetical protein